MLTKEELQNGLNTFVFGKKIFDYNSIDSTNSCAKMLAGSGAEEGTVVIAEFQTAGRGRLGRVWQSQSGSNLLFSVIIRPKLEINKIGLLPFFAAAGAAQALENVTGSYFECKWPNDILLNGKKSCGILLESSFQHNTLDYAIIGMGVNVNQKEFGGNIKDGVTSLCLEFEKEFDRREVFRQIMISLELLYSDVRTGNFTRAISEWKSRTSIFGKQISINQSGERLQGIAVGLSDDGGLILDTRNGQRICYAGDVTFTNES
ncbi:MAG: biotin--[acetyl-CoA-carboxylase] ligase [Bacteroidetes bacterium]|nr:biotin--[acetyl-CoA-carboxylase] ligase [Bacteroidota bacterium]